MLTHNSKDAKFTTDLYGSPRCRTPESSDSDESMDNHLGNVTPPATPPNPHSLSAEPAAQMGRLSLNHGREISQAHDFRGRTDIASVSVVAPKRAASTEIPRSSDVNASVNVRCQQDSTAFAQGRKVCNRRGQNTKSSMPRIGQVRLKQHPGLAGPQQKRVAAVRQNAKGPIYRDSGYDSMPSRANTLQQQSLNHATGTWEALQGKAPTDFDDHAAPQFIQSSQEINNKRYSGLILQPDSSPISQDQLAAEVKGIYGGLVMVEAKCINIDAAQIADPKSHLEPDQWQALVALHRTLLYEHHDFLMATQHPSATPALRGLATKYSMPARMWRHGIHAFLEVLRFRRPESQDYMLAFIYLAYQMIALLYETVPTFTDTWIECLGDLARYRMAIEEETEFHSIWEGVAARWYTMAAQRHPEVGRLYHHLGILERAGLQKLLLYVKSLTCVVPFSNARASLTTLYGPMLREGAANQKTTYSTETRIVIFHAHVFSASDSSTITNAKSKAIAQFQSQSSSKLRHIAAPLMVTNIAAVLELGAPSNTLFQSFGKMINEDIQSSRPSASWPGCAAPHTHNTSQIPVAGTFASSLIYDFYFETFNVLLLYWNDLESLADVLPAVYTGLIWLRNLYVLQSRVNDVVTRDTICSLLDPRRLSWGGLAAFLNTLAQYEPITIHSIEYARQGILSAVDGNEASRPLPEDDLMHGLIWTHSHYPTAFFNGQSDDEWKPGDSANLQKIRVSRVQTLGLFLAFRSDYLNFETHTKSFWAPSSGPTLSPPPIGISARELRCEPKLNTRTAASRSPATLSAHSDSDGYQFVGAPKAKLAKTYANIASKPTKSSPKYDRVQVVGDDPFQWEA